MVNYSYCANFLIPFLEIKTKADALCNEWLAILGSGGDGDQAERYHLFSFYYIM